MSQNNTEALTIHEAVRRIRAALPAQTTLLGFCGAPWTVATYMIAGRGTADQAPARLLAYRDPNGFSDLIDRLVEASISYLCAQIEAGAQAVQIFDSWAGALAPSDYVEYVLPHVQNAIGRVRASLQDLPPTAIPIIYFGTDMAARENNSLVYTQSISATDNFDIPAESLVSSLWANNVLA